MNNFYQKMIGLVLVDPKGSRKEIIACWQINAGVRCLTVGVKGTINEGATYLVDLPDTDYEVEML